MKFVKVIKADFSWENNKILALIRQIELEADNLKNHLVFVDENQEYLDDNSFTKLENEIQEYAPILKDVISKIEQLDSKMFMYRHSIESIKFK